MNRDDLLYYDKNYTELRMCEALEEDLNYRAAFYISTEPLIYSALKLRALDYRKRARQAEVNLEYLIYKLKAIDKNESL